jgi:hypothetical protein
MNIKAIGAYATLWTAGALMMALVLFITLGVSFDLGWIEEDGLLFNCHFMGNWACGPEASWHGFVNLF